MLKKIGNILIIILCIFIPLVLTAQEIQVKASVSATEVEIGEQFTYSVTISGNVANVPSPQIPELPDFRVYSAGTSSSFQFIQGTVSSSITHNYALVPLKEGTFTIGAAKIEFGGKIYQTQPITVKVVAKGSKPAPKRQRPAPTMQEQLFRQQQEGELFVRAIVDKTTVYINEPVLLRYKIYYKNVALSQQYNRQLPSFTGFWVEDVPPPKRRTRSVEIYRDTQYYTIVLETRVLFPTSPGSHTIGKASFEFVIEDIFSFFGRRVVRETEPITIKVLPLPAKGKPAGFKGSVGNYKIDTALSTKKIKQNQPFVLKVIVSGTGNIKTITEPEMPELKDFKLYDSRSSLNIQKSEQGISGSKVFEYILIPTSAGELEINSFKFHFFSTKNKKYVTLMTEPIKLKSEPGPATSSLPVMSAPGSTPVQLVGKDIRFIKENIPIKNQGAYIYKKSGIWLLIMLPFLALATVYGYSRYKLRLETDVQFARASRAYKLAKRRIKLIEKKLSSDNLKDIGTDFEKLLIEYIADKLNIPPASIVMDTIKKLLIKRNIPETMINKIEDIYGNINIIKYAPSTVPKEEYKKLLQHNIDVINKFETLRI